MTLTSNPLAQLVVSLGEPFAGAGNRPIWLEEPDTVWFIENGEVDVFLLESRDGSLADFKHVQRALPGRLLFGIPPGEGGEMAVLIRGLPGAELRRLSLQSLMALMDGSVVEEALADQVDCWIEQFTAAVARDITLRPRPDILLDSGDEVDTASDQVISARRGVAWVAARDAAFLGTEEPSQDGPGLIPLTPDGWLELREPSQLVGLSSRQLIDNEQLFPALAEFHRMILSAEQLNRSLLMADTANRQSAGVARRRLDEAQSRSSLFGLLDSHSNSNQEGGSNLMDALASVGKWQGISFRTPPRARTDVESGQSLDDVLTASGVRARRIRLKAEDSWWLGDSGPMLGFLRDGGHPVALLPSSIGRYRIVDPRSKRSAAIYAARAGQLEENAYTFYRPLSPDQPVGARHLLNLMGRHLTADLIRFTVTGLAVGLLMLIPAIVVGALVDSVLPSGSGSTLLWIAAGLVTLAVIGGLLRILHGTALLRIEGRVAAVIGAAVWDRLLGLPPRFLRQFMAGDLETRLMAFQTLRDSVSGVAANALLSVVFLLPTFALLFFYSTTLAWLNLGIGLLAFGVTIVLGLRQLAPQRDHHTALRRLTGELFQLVNGIGKLRMSGAEGSAFAAWARNYAQQKHAEIGISRLNEHLTAFSAAVPGLASAALFGVAFGQDAETLTVGNFLVVYSASMMFYLALMRLGASFEAIAAILPSYEQTRPILTTMPESVPHEGAAVDLNGELQFDNVSFRYFDDGPLILDGISIHTRPGEFIALVGESGSGKSTLVRLALGLEEPSAGAVYYDRRELARINLRAVRRQIGVVTQDGTLQPGTILDNIIGLSSDLTIDDAWRAARMAAVEGDIAAMPMGMFTPVDDGAANFSGGQVQRIRIAAALVRNPRIVFLDEATNWLDTRSQAEVMQGIEGLATTRLVIAHRLSTIRKADRIYVLQGGRVIQQGAFDELFQTEGVFRSLALRQMA